MSEREEKYQQQINAMVERYGKWKKANIGRRAIFKYPPLHVTTVMPIGTAIGQGLVKVNKTARELIAALWDEKNEPEPTVLMIRYVLEYAQVKDKK